MERVVVYEKSGKILLATMINKHEEISPKNLKDYIPCPVELRHSIPESIDELCRKNAPCYLFLDKKRHWNIKQA